MRLLAIAAAAGLSLAFAATASAGPVIVRPLTVDADLQKKFDDDYGVREIKELQDALNRALAAELAAVGGAVASEGPITIETTLVDAKPSRPTRAQGDRRPGLDTIRSVSLGGAELKARIVAADGRVLNEFSYDWYEYDLANVYGASTWSDARRAIRRYADRVAEAYRVQAPG